jgi:ribosome-binding factor A
MAIGSPKTSAIKRAQKESALFRIISFLVHQATLEQPVLQGLSVTRAELSPGKTLCTVYFYTAQGKEHFDKVLPELKLFKPSIRKSIADEMQSRYTVELMFKYDAHFEKKERIDRLLDSIKTESDSNE